jgi:hypothetical protein
MEHTPRTEPVSMHLERHRDCLERHRRKRADPRAAIGDAICWPDLPWLNGHAGPVGALPFERPDDED